MRCTPTLVLLALGGRTAVPRDVQMDHGVGRLDGFHVPEGDWVAVRRFLDAERAGRASAAAPSPLDAPSP